MNNFEQIKNDFAVKCKVFSPCSSEYNRLLRSTTGAEMLQVIYDNISWCTGNKLLSQEFFSQFTPEVFIESGIANTGKENTGFVNSGYSNSGDRNSGNSNSGNWNSGDRNSGNSNSGNWNSGNRNSGDSNSGYRNSGDWNSGNRNSGDSNSGDSNSGNWNSGNRNSGDSNSGYSNSGDSNSGNWNSGNRNSGDSNSGYRNAGAFCIDPNPKLILFDQVTDITVKEWEQMEVCNLMYNIEPTIFVPMSIMTDAEKAAHPKYETTEGYLKTITMHEAWANFWGNLSDDKKALFTSLPGFDAAKFKIITGITI